MNILITGSNGFIGSRLMWELVKDGHKVIGIDISNHCDGQRHPMTLSGDIRKVSDLNFIHGAFLQKHNAEIDLIIHCAAAKHDFGVNRGEYFSHNKYGTKTLLRFASEKGIRKLINISSVAVFGHPIEQADETAPYAPDHPYGESKLAGELLSIEWQRQDPTRELIVLRPAVIYGPYNFANVYKLIDMMHRRPWVTIGTGDHVKAIVARSTVIDMIRFGIQVLKPGYEHYNCVDEPYITLGQLMEIIALNPAFRIPKIKLPLAYAVAIGFLFDVPAKLLSIDLPVNRDRMRKLATATYFTAEKIHRDGFVQRYSIEDSVAEMCDWYLKNQKWR